MSEKKERTRARDFVFTVQNWTEDDLVKILNFLEGCVYCIIGFETAPETGTPHLQGYVYWKNARFLTTMQKVFNNYCKPALGTAKQNQKYCSKGGDFYEYGEPPEQGKRTDLINFRDDILKGASEEDILENHIECIAKYDRLYRRCRNIVLKKEAKKRAPLEVVVLTGPTGIGKTRYVYDNHDIDDIYKVEVGDGSSGSIWWDNYDGEKIILIDDFHNNFKLDYMLRLLDRYPMKLNIKGGHTWRCATKIYITSNIDPKYWYPNCDQKHRDAVMRRLTTIIDLTNGQPLPIEELTIEREVTDHISSICSSD